MIKYSIFLPVVLITVFSQTEFSSTEIYGWVDENGVTHFSDRKPPESELQEVETVDPSRPGNLPVVPMEHPGPAGFSGVEDFSRSGEKPDLNKNLHVVTYTTDW